jgi:type IV pilus assembly protein PilZ
MSDDNAQHPDDDRRESPRAPIELKVEYKRLNSFFADYTRNISRGGTFIRTAKPLDIGTEFTFKLVVPKLEKPLELRGKVQWMIRPEDAEGTDQEPGMGIGFIYQSEAERQRIEGIVEKLMVDSLGPILYEKLMRRRDEEMGEE